jgi:predicted nucleotidyltransferase
VLVEFEEGHVPGLAFFAMEQELSGLLGKRVDLIDFCTMNAIHWSPRWRPGCDPRVLPT